MATKRTVKKSKTPKISIEEQRVLTLVLMDLDLRDVNLCDAHVLALVRGLRDSREALGKANAAWRDALEQLQHRGDEAERALVHEQARSRAEQQKYDGGITAMLMVIDRIRFGPPRDSRDPYGQDSPVPE
jgi:hypothetical protein